MLEHLQATILYNKYECLDCSKVAIANIINFTPINNRLKYSEELENRIKDLGLSKLVSEEGETKHDLRSYQVADELAKNLDEKLSTIAWKVTQFDKTDVKKAVDYLEVFILFVAQNAFTEHIGMEEFDDEVKLGKIVFRTIKILEEINDSSKRNKKVLKNVLDSKLNALNSDINEILSKNISYTQGQLFSKKVKRAMKILNQYK